LFINTFVIVMQIEREIDIVVRLDKKQVRIEVKKALKRRTSLHLHKSILLAKREISLFLASIE